MENMKLNILKTANGFYVEHESNGEMIGYSVVGNNWEDLNPKKHGITESPFEVAKNADSPNSDNSELEALKTKNTELETQVDEFTKLKEFAGDVDIAEAIEAFKTKSPEVSDVVTSENDSPESLENVGEGNPEDETSDTELEEK